ncbi:MAG TPA: hypothetical protein VF520_09305 [Thermoleophilaceae bacterium]|jgi:hypothetical protein
MSAPDRAEDREGAAAEAPAAAEQDGPTGAAAGEAAPAAYAIPHALAQATLDYLASRPYREVFALVRGFESLEPLADEAPSPATPRLPPTSG